MNIPLYDTREIVECAFVAWGFCGDEYCTGFGYPFKFFNDRRYKPLSLPFAPGGPIEIIDNGMAEPTTISTQTATSTPTSATGSSQNSPTASPPSSSGAFPTGPASGIKNGTTEGLEPKNGSGLSNGVIAGIGAGGATLVIIIAVLSFLLFRRHRKNGVTAAAAATSSNSTAGSSSPGDGGETPEKGGALPTYFKAELEDNPKSPWTELDGTCITPPGADKKEKPQVAELGADRAAAEGQEKFDQGKCQERYELA